MRNWTAGKTAPINLTKIIIMENLLIAIFGFLVCSCPIVMFVYALPEIKDGAVLLGVFVFGIFFATMSVGFAILQEAIRCAMHK